MVYDLPGTSVTVWLLTLPCDEQADIYTNNLFGQCRSVCVTQPHLW